MAKQQKKAADDRVLTIRVPVDLDAKMRKLADEDHRKLGQWIRVQLERIVEGEK